MQSEQHNSRYSASLDLHLLSRLFKLKNVRLTGLYEIADLTSIDEQVSKSVKGLVIERERASYKLELIVENLSSSELESALQEVLTSC